MNVIMERLLNTIFRYFGFRKEERILLSPLAPSIVKDTEGNVLPKHKNKEKIESVPDEMGAQIECFLQTCYDFRFNLLTDETEFSPSTGQGVSVYITVGQRELNTLCMDARASGIACWDRDLSRYIFSTRIPSYHPLRLYMTELSCWDGRQRLEALAKRVSDDPLWIRSFHTWMLALAAQWMGVENVHANSVAPMLVSSKQGHQKSTFCKVLLPESLYRYYTDSMELTSQGQAERKLAEMALINFDEFDKYSPKKMPLIKNLMQMASLNLRKSHQKNFRLLPRIASFIGTSNRKDLLTDPSGSRRFVCVEVENEINVTGIEHEQIYAELKAELNAGARYWYTKEEEQEIQQHNASFSRQCPAGEVLLACYRSPLPDEEYVLLSSVEIFKELKKRNPAAMQGANPSLFSQVLIASGIERRHTNKGNVYKVVRLNVNAK